MAGDALITFVRERGGVEIIRKHAAARAVLKALRRNETVGIPFDQNAKRSEAIFWNAGELDRFCRHQDRIAGRLSLRERVAG